MYYLKRSFANVMSTPYQIECASHAKYGRYLRLNKPTCTRQRHSLALRPRHVAAPATPSLESPSGA